MPLSLAVLSKISNADSTRIESKFLDLPGFWRANRWLSKNNRYQRDTIKRLNADHDGNAVKSADLLQYIAASSVLHSMDGWEYLGAAVRAHLAGATETSVHLGYYAELRAAMSLLASQGVGVFDKYHFAIGSAGKVEFVGRAPRTHVFAWEALDGWAGSTKASPLIFNVLRPGALALEEWLGAFSHTPAASGLVVKDWIQRWGIDLQRLTSDREARNVSSYRPTVLSTSDKASVDDSIEMIRDFWGIAEPSVGGFHLLDAHLLRQALEFKFRNTIGSGRTAKQSKAKYRQQIRSMLHTIAPVTFPGSDWESFLLRATHPQELTLLTRAGGAKKAGTPGHAIEVLARATVLLRIASGASRSLLMNCSKDDRDELRFWLEETGAQAGFCEKGGLAEASADYWADIEIGLVDIDEWVGAIAVEERTRKRFKSECASASSMLSIAQLAGIWALGL